MVAVFFIHMLKQNALAHTVIVTCDVINSKF